MEAISGRKIKNNVNKVRVLQFTVSQSKGGQTQFILNTWRLIDKSKYSFDFVTFSTKLDFEKELIESGSRVFHLSCYYRDNPEQFVKEFDNVLRHGYDVIHIHTNYWDNAIVEDRANALGIKKIIIHSHSTSIHNSSDPIEIDRKTRLHCAFREQMDFSMATDYCACSKEAAEWLFGNRMPLDVIRIIHNGIDTQKYRFDKDVRSIQRENLKIENEELLLGVVGRLEYVKNPEFIIRLLPELLKRIRVKLLIVGAGSCERKCRELVSQLSIEEKVIFIGFSESVSSLLQAIDVFCMPSKKEAFGISLVEAQCVGAPCIVSDCISDEAIVTDLVTKIKLDSNNWIDSIVNVARRPVDRSNYYKVVEDSGLDIRSQVKSLEELYSG